MSFRFSDKAFLINETAKELYETVSTLPIIDFCADIPADIFRQNRKYRNIGELLTENSAKGRTAMRMCGADEDFITGNTSDFDKFSALASAMPRLMLSPVCSENHLILSKIFGFNDPISPYNTEEIWNFCNSQIDIRRLSPLSLARELNADSICIKIDPASEPSGLPEFESDGVDVYPIFNAAEFSSGTGVDFHNSLRRLSDACDAEITDLMALKASLLWRLKVFIDGRCRSVYVKIGADFKFFRNTRLKETDDVFQKMLRGDAISENERSDLATSLLLFIIEETKKSGVILLMETPDNASPALIRELWRLFEYLQKYDRTAKTVIIGSDAAKFLPLADKFTFRNERGFPGILLCPTDPEKLTGLCPSVFALPGVGIPDVLSLVKHDIARRKLCSQISQRILAGEIPYDADEIKSLTEDICCWNMKNFFDI